MLQKSRQLDSNPSSSSSSSTSDDKKKAQLENRAATQSPFMSTPTVNKNELLEILESLLSKLVTARKLKLKASSSFYTTSSSFQIPILTLTVSSKISFSVQETKSGQSNQASNANTLVSKSVTFTANDGTNPISITNLSTPIQMAIPKNSPSTPGNDSSLYKCAYYDEASRSYKTDGCSFIGENLTYIFCQCNHATEFAAQINEETLNSFDNFFNKPSLQELLELSSVVTTASRNQAFTLELQKNILSKTSKAVREYKLQRVNYWPIAISFIILVLLVMIYPTLKFFQSVKRDYFASFETETFAIPEQQAKIDEIKPSKCSFQEAKFFWSVYSLVHGKFEKHLTSYTVRTFCFYTEVLNLMGNVLLWTLFYSYSKQNSAILKCLYTVVLALITSLGSYHFTLGIVAYWKIRSLRKYRQIVEKGGIYPSSRFTCLENFQLALCLVVIFGWLVLFAAFSTLLSNTEMQIWLGCSLVAALVSYIIIDSILVFLCLVTKWRKLFLILALRSLSSQYVS